MAADDYAPKPRVSSQFSDGWSHDLTPLAPLDVRRCASADEMLRQMSHTAFGGRRLGEAADVLYEMTADEDCFVVGTFSGAMTIGKMGLLVTEMIEQGMLNAVVSTGALMCHGLIEESGRTHFKHDPSWDDVKLYEAGYDRVYDTLELEQNLASTERLLSRVLDEIAADQPFGSRELLERVGGWLRRESAGRGILQAAHEKGVPVYVPAFTDSELGLDLFTHNAKLRLEGKPELRFEPMRDLSDYYERLKDTKRLGIFTIGGGVPRNWAQQGGPLGELLHERTKGRLGGMLRFRYALRICPEPVHWGGLSGCTYSEGVSWGKFVPQNHGGRFAEVLSDATVAWPLLLRGVLERLGRV